MSKINRTLLEEWQAKKSWQMTLPLIPIYRSKTTGGKDLSLSALCSKEKILTLNKEYGFEEIKILKPGNESNPKYGYLQEILPKLSTPLKTISELLIKEIKRYFIELWDNSKFHLVFCSAGMDSRIISQILMQLQEQYGQKWLGDIHFRCHEPEGELFKKVMKEQGWSKDQYSVYKEGEDNKPDYYLIGEFASNVNAFHRPTVEFWDDIVPKHDEKDTVLVNGACGGELFSYSLYPNRAFSDNRYNDLIANTRAIFVNFCKGYNRWENILMPYLGYKYLDIAFRIPRQYFKWDIIQGQKRDLIRCAMIRRLGTRLPFYIGHSYNLQISPERATYMKIMYHQSKFYRDYKHLNFVRNAKPWKVYSTKTKNITHNLDLKLYGYATMYEQTSLNMNNVGRENA